MTDSDRRPIAARNTAWAARLSNALVARGASANGISIAGMAAALIAGTALALIPGHPPIARLLWIVAALGIQLRLLANLLDGMVAIGRGIASPTGELFNELPDRVSDTAILAGLGLAAHSPALGLAAALAAMATAYIRAVGRGLGQPSDFAGPMAKQQRMAVVTILAAACAILPHGWTLQAPRWTLWLLLAGALATTLRRLARLAARLRAAPGSHA